MSDATYCFSDANAKRRGTGETIFELGWNWDDFLRGISNHYKIRERKSGVYRPWGPLFTGRKFQRDLAKALHEDLDRGGPSRWAIVKSRKVGASTFLAGMALDIAQKIPWNIGILAHEQGSTEYIFGIARTMYEQQTRAKPQLRFSRKAELLFGATKREDRQEGDTGLMSRISCGTAGGRHPFTGSTLHMLVMDECAKYELDAAGFDALLTSVMGSVPTEGPSLVVKCSTANGQQGDFYETIMQSLEDTRKGTEPQYKVFFRPWWDDEGNTMPVEDKYDWDAWPKDDREREDMLRQKWMLTSDQLRWRRFQIKQLRGDVLNFDQEFPDTIMSAFKNPSKPAIPRSIMERLKSGLKPAMCRYGTSLVDFDVVDPSLPDQPECKWIEDVG